MVASKLSRHDFFNHRLSRNETENFVIEKVLTKKTYIEQIILQSSMTVRVLRNWKANPKTVLPTASCGPKWSKRDWIAWEVLWQVQQCIGYRLTTIPGKDRFISCLLFQVTLFFLVFSLEFQMYYRVCKKTLSGLRSLRKRLPLILLRHRYV